MAVVVADLVARLRADDDGVQQALTRTETGLQRVDRQAQTTARTTTRMASAEAAAYNRAQAAAARRRIAEDQLAAAQRSGVTSTQQLLTLEARAHSARAASISATSRYQQVQRGAANATTTLGGANRRLATSQTTAAQAAGAHTRSLSELQLIATKMRATMQTLGLAAGITTLTKFFVDSIQNARRLSAQTNQLSVVFGEGKNQIEAWGQTAKDTMRMSQREAQGAAVQFATFGKAAGLTGQNLAAFSMTSTKLAADLASFQGIPVEEAILAMGSAFAGETETMRKYGVLLDENTLKETAYANGLAAKGSQLTQQQKVAAIYLSIMKQLDYAHGDVERSNGKFGASIKTLQARFEEVSASIGQKLMPIAQTFIDLLSGPGLDGLSGVGEGLGILSKTVGLLGSAFNALPGPVQAALASIVAFRLAQRLLFSHMGQGPGIFSRFNQQITNVQRAATVTGQSMGRLQATTVAAGHAIRNASPVVTQLHAAFLRSRASATSFGNAVGAIGAVGAGVGMGLRGLMGALGGPWGLAIAGATALLGLWISKKQKDAAASQEAENRTNSWSDALKQSGGAIDQNIRAMVARDMGSKHMFDNLDKLGLSERQLADAVLMRGDAYEEAYAKVYKLAYDTRLTDDNKAAIQAARALLPNLKSMADQMGQAESRAMQLARSSGNMSVSFDKTASAAGPMTTAMTEFAESTDGAASKVDKLAKALDQLNDDQMSQEEALQQWSDNLRELAETMTEYGAASIDAAGRIDVTTEAGSKLQDAVREQASAFNESAAAAYEYAQSQGMGVGESLDYVRQKLVAQREQFIQQGMAAGRSRETMEALANTYGLIPSEVVTRIDVVGAQSATDALRNVGIAASTLPPGRLFVTDNTPEVRAKLDELHVRYKVIDGKVVLDTNHPDVIRGLESVGAQIRNLPNGMVQISDTSPQVLRRLAELGIKVQNMPDGSVVINAADAEFWKAVQRATAPAEKRITLVANFSSAMDELNAAIASGDAERIRRANEAFVGSTNQLSRQGGHSAGGWTGPGSKYQPAGIVHADEFVIRKESRARIERDHPGLLDSMNAHGVVRPGYAEGGQVAGGAASESDATSAAASAGAGPVPGAVAGNSILGGLGLGLASTLGSVASQVTSIKDGQLDPAMEGLTSGVATYGLTTQQQADAVIAKWRDTGAQVQSAVVGVLAPAIKGAGTATQSMVSGLVTPSLAGMRGAWMSTGSQLAGVVAGQINPSAMSVGATVQAVHAGTVDPVLGAMRGAVANTANSFGTGAQAIAAQWNQVREATASPVRFTIGTVFNQGLVGMWNSVSDLVGTTRMNPYPIAFASGGVMPGYTPGTDVHHFTSPTGGNLALSGGEAIMRPEWTRAVGGPLEVDRMNALARAGRLKRVKGTDQYLGGDMAFASGGTIQGGAEITSAIQRTMWDAVRTAFPNVVLTSGTRYADVGSGFDNHMGQRALDLGGPMPEIARWIYQMNRKQPVEELIHAPLQGWQNLKAGKPLNYGAGTDADHYDHVHWAMAQMVNNAGRLVSMAAGSGGAPAVQKSMAQIIDETLAPLRKTTEAQVSGARFAGRVGALPRAIYTRINDAMTAKLKDLATKYMGPAIGGGGDVERWRPMVIAALKRNGFEPSKRNQDLMLSQIASESGGNPGIVQGVQDVNSGGNEAVGLLQVTPGTFATHRDPSLPDDRRDAWANMNAALRYYRARYGGDLGTMWGQGHGYANGGTIPGSGNRDTVPAVLTPGEEVISKGPAEKNRPMLKKINAGDDVRVFVTNWPKQSTPTTTTDYTTTTPTVDTTTADLEAYTTATDDATTAETELSKATTEHEAAVTKVHAAEAELAKLRKEKADPAKLKAAEKAVAEAKKEEAALKAIVDNAATPTTTTSTGLSNDKTSFTFDLLAPVRPKWWTDAQNAERDRIIREYEEQKTAQEQRDGTTTTTPGGTTTKKLPTLEEAEQDLADAEDALAIAEARKRELKPEAKESQKLSAQRAVEKAQRKRDDARKILDQVKKVKPATTNSITKMWTGGTVPGSGNGDIIPAMLTPGEEVTRKKMAIKHRALLKAINRDDINYYAAGGSAGGFGGYTPDTRDAAKPKNLYDWISLGVGGASAVAGMVAPYAKMALSGQVDLGSLTPGFDTGANDPSGGFGSAIVSDYANQISQQLAEIAHLLATGQNVHITVDTKDPNSAANLIGMAKGI